MGALAVPPATQPVCGGEHLIQRGEVHRPHRGTTLDLQAEQHSVERHAVDERLRAVNRVDEPAESGPLLFLGTELLAHDGMLRITPLDLRSDELLRSPVGSRDRRKVTLEIRLETGLVITQGQSACLIGSLYCKFVVLRKIHRLLYVLQDNA
jgi:hypothetical protein